MNQIDALPVVVGIAYEARDGAGRFYLSRQNLRPVKAGVNDGNDRVMFSNSSIVSPIIVPTSFTING